MKNFLLVAAAVMATAPAFSADVGALGGLGEPGYRQIGIRWLRKPQLVVFSEPVVIRQVDDRETGEPVYLHVPPAPAKDWR